MRTCWRTFCRPQWCVSIPKMTNTRYALPAYLLLCSIFLHESVFDASFLSLSAALISLGDSSSPPVCFLRRRTNVNNTINFLSLETTFRNKQRKLHCKREKYFLWWVSSLCMIFQFQGKSFKSKTAGLVSDCRFPLLRPSLIPLKLCWVSPPLEERNYSAKLFLIQVFASGLCVKLCLCLLWGKLPFSILLFLVCHLVWAKTCASLNTSL